jgi:hypothetical protein
MTEKFGKMSVLSCFNMVVIILAAIREDSTNFRRQVLGLLFFCRLDALAGWF